MSDWQIKCATIAALLARLHALSVSDDANDRAEAQDIQRELWVRRRLKSPSPRSSILSSLTPQKPDRARVDFHDDVLSSIGT
jgi:hypothetical protein